MWVRPTSPPRLALRSPAETAARSDQDNPSSHKNLVRAIYGLLGINCDVTQCTRPFDSHAKRILMARRANCFSEGVAVPSRVLSPCLCQLEAVINGSRTQTGLPPRRHPPLRAN